MGMRYQGRSGTPKSTGKILTAPAHHRPKRPPRCRRCHHRRHWQRLHGRHHPGIQGRTHSPTYQYHRPGDLWARSGADHQLRHPARSSGAAAAAAFPSTESGADRHHQDGGQRRTQPSSAVRPEPHSGGWVTLMEHFHILVYSHSQHSNSSFYPHKRHFNEPLVICEWNVLVSLQFGL